MSGRYYRAALHLVELERVTDPNGYEREVERLHVADLQVTGQTPADALSQAQRHVGELTEWHTQLEREHTSRREREEQTSGR